MKSGLAAISELIDLFRTATTGPHNALGSIRRPFAAQRSGGRQRLVEVAAFNNDEVAGFFQSGERGIQGAKRNVGDEAQLSTQTSTDFVAVKWPVVEES